MSGLEPDATALDQVGDGREGLPVAAAVAADGENEVTERVAPVGDFEGFFHVGGGLGLLEGFPAS